MTITFNEYGRGVSTRTGKDFILDYIKRNFLEDIKILDVGFGYGIYARLLRGEGFSNIDGVDIYPKGIRELGIDKFYNNIFIKDIRRFNFHFYDLIILGDVLEHLSLEDGQALLNNWIGNNKCDYLIISIPFLLSQGGTSKNPYEEHLQDKVTRDYMDEHFPYLKLIYSKEMEEISGKTIAIYMWSR